MKKNIKKLKNPNTNTFDAFIKFAAFVLTKPGYQFLRKHILRSFGKMNIIYEGKFMGGGDGLVQKHRLIYNNLITKKLSKEVLTEEYNLTKNFIKKTPKISIILPVYNPPLHFLKEAIKSVLAQSYTNWELCIADDLSPDKLVLKTLKDFANQDERIKVIFRTENGHISAASNTALGLATGTYVLFMDHDDLVTPNCLFEFAKHINLNPDNEIIYSDEDKINDEGFYLDPHFKPDWAPDNLLSRNYIGHVLVIKKQLVDKIGSFRLGFEGSQDYDLLLRATEMTAKIGHIPKILYHWRIHKESVSQSLSISDIKPYAYTAAKKALEDTLIRRKTPGTVEFAPTTIGIYNIKYNIENYEKVSIIIPTKDHVSLLKTALVSIFSKTHYPDYEVIVLNNNSCTSEFSDLMKYYNQKYPSNFKCIEANFPFNYSKLMNIGVNESSGAYILFLNNDVEIIHDDWMTQMVSYAQRKNTGIVGVKLLYPNSKIQHVGVVLGFGGAAGHVFVNMDRHESGYFNYIKSLNNYSALTGACIMCKKSIYFEVGGMDEELEVEFNDVDLCLKVFTAGYYNVYLPTVELFHHESATRGHPFSSKKSYDQHIKNLTYFNTKWKTLIENDPFYNINLSLEADDFRIKEIKAAE
jgi:glycosyltransferase involved in cell wall biosynthesis